MEFDLIGEVFAKTERDYSADPEGKWAAGTSRKLTILDFDTRSIHEVKFKTPDAVEVYRRTALDEHVELRVSARAAGNRLDLTFVGYKKPDSVAPVKSA